MTIRLDCLDSFYERLTYTDTNRHVRLSISVVCNPRLLYISQNQM